jgi:hypothetical protein
MEAPFTQLQGQYLAFIAACTRVDGRSPAEADRQQYFGVAPPSVHSMILSNPRQHTSVSLWHNGLG